MPKISNFNDVLHLLVDKAGFDDEADTNLAHAFIDATSFATAEAAPVAAATETTPGN